MARITVSPAGYLTRLHYDLTTQFAVVDVDNNRLIAVFTNEAEAIAYANTLKGE